MNKRFELFPGAKLGIAAFTLCLAAANLTAAKPNPNPPPPAPVLGSAATFAVLAGSAVTNVGNTVINGDLGISPAAGTFVTGFPPGVVNGTQHLNDTTAAQAQLDLTTAFNSAAGLPGGAPITDLNNSPATALKPGLYYSPTTNMIIGTGGNTLSTGQRRLHLPDGEGG